VADLANEAARSFLVDVAHARGKACVPLLAAPVDASRHVLEVYTPGSTEPLRLLADPVGAPGKDGFPLRLAPIDADVAQEERADATRERVAAPVRGDDVPDDQAETWTAARAPVLRRETPTAGLERPPVEPRREVEVVVSAAHAADLGGTPPLPAAPPVDPLIGRQLAGGKLEIESFVGKGLMGVVYRARHRALGTILAVKVMHEALQRDVDFCRRFYAEALALSRLDHPNLVRVHDFGQETDGLLYLAMDFLEGRSLRDVIRREAPLAAPRIAEIMLQVCAGLGHAHARGIVHRDVKPDNVMLLPGVDDDGRVIEVPRVCDFGLALASSKEALRERFAGTPVYMSPEQCRGEELDARTDVYACGILLYELATGTPPFVSEKPIVVVNRHLSMPPPPMTDHVPGVDPRLEHVVERALKKNRAERYQDVRELRADLKTLLEARPAHGGVFDLEAEAERMELPPPSLPPMPSVSLPPPPAGVEERQRLDTVPREEPDRQDTVPRSELGRADTMPRSRDFARGESPIRADVRVRQSPVPAPPSSQQPSSERRPSKAPEWLEHNPDRYEQFLSGMATGTNRGEELAGMLAREPTSWLRKLTAERDIRSFQRMLAELEIALRMLAKRADARAMWAASSALDGIATQETQAPGSRGQRAGLLLRLFNDPGMLGPVSERLLLHDDDARDAARTLVTRAGVAGAYALYGARVKLAPHAQVRHPFVTTMRDIRDAGWPVTRAALERIPDAALVGAHPLAADLAEDLLLSVPNVRDEDAGRLVAKFVRAREPGLCRAATGALARLWADRAQPVLFGLLDDADEGVRVAAIVGLRELGAIDEHVVRKLAPLMTRSGGGRELRLAALSALEVATLDARPLAATLLVQFVRDPAPDDATVLAAARALVAIAASVAEVRLVVVSRAERSGEPLRSHLLALTTGMPVA
jgi:serine/threonine-protein kinase